jgi:hypothetical protein
MRLSLIGSIRLLSINSLLELRNDFRFIGIEEFVRIVFVVQKPIEHEFEVFKESKLLLFLDIKLEDEPKILDKK